MKVKSIYEKNTNKRFLSFTDALYRSHYLMDSIYIDSIYTIYRHMVLIRTYLLKELSMSKRPLQIAIKTLF